ncbi:MAG: AtpZ/AtpI family protein, partial [Actinomycetota bacterium]
MNSPQPEKKKKQGLFLRSHRTTVNSTKGMSPAILLGSSFAIAMGIFSWLGHRWDEKTGNAPWGVLAGVTAGFAYGGYEVWKLVRMSDQAAK